jgi:hypothetical protein
MLAHSQRKVRPTSFACLSVCPSVHMSWYNNLRTVGRIVLRLYIVKLTVFVDMCQFNLTSGNNHSFLLQDLHVLLRQTCTLAGAQPAKY